MREIAIPDESKRPPGRPRKNVDPKRVIELASMGYNAEQIGALEDCGKDLIYTRFQKQYEKGRSLCDAMLQRKQVEKALAGNGDTTMLIWLGKQRLGQKDKQEVESIWQDLGYGGLPVPKRESELGTTDKPN